MACQCLNTVIHDYSALILLYAVQLVSPYCVTVYGGLCALASFDREDLYTKVLTSR